MHRGDRLRSRAVTSMPRRQNGRRDGGRAFTAEDAVDRIARRRKEDEYDEKKDEPKRVVKEVFPDHIKRRQEFVRRVTREVALNTEVAKKMFPYTHEFITNLFFNKHVVFMGDSLTRGIYKDFIGLLQNRCILEPHSLKAKSEHSHMHDRQIDFLPLDSDRVFRQAREYMTEYNLVQYFFTTRVMKDDVERALLQMQKSQEFPDLIVINSALWDLTRYFDDPASIKAGDPYSTTPEFQKDSEQKNLEEYIHRLAMLMRRFRTILPPTTQVIWLCMPWPMPVGQSMVTGRLDMVNMRSLHRSLYLDGNFRAAQVVASFGYDVLDLGFYLRNHSLYPYRVHDGVHWDAVGTRLMTELLVGHVALNIGDKLPLDIKNALDRMKNEATTSTGWLYLKHSNTHTDLNGEEDVRKLRGSYANKLQRQLDEMTLKEMDEKLREAIVGDIEALRTSELIRQRGLQVVEDDDDEVEQMADATPRVKQVLKTEWKPQRIIHCKPPTSATYKPSSSANQGSSKPSSSTNQGSSRHSK